ncbi:MAG: hypothetical protein RDV41_15325, partial [Planctomycetota bacterium]|nr:hypothetical protein [Planctomycetota bacterium]
MAVDFNPVDLGTHIVQQWAGDGNRRHVVTFLLGAGCSKSAGVPLAREIVAELRNESKTNPFLRDAGAAPPGVSEYAFLMEKLGSPHMRAKRVKGYVDRARGSAGRLRINWTYLLLAAMVENGYVNRILTTNFDPLIVEALAVMGQPIRTYDLNTTGKYYPGTLDPASIIYLHGQMHSLFLANTPEEMGRLKKVYPSVLQEAVQNSLLVVVGYSGDCDPVLDALQELPNFPCGLWWSHFEGNPGSAVEALFKKYGADCHIARGDDADTFMRKLVLDGMKLDLPDEVMTPITAARLALERITPFPTKDFTGGDPVRSSLELLKLYEVRETATKPPAAGPLPTTDAAALRPKSEPIQARIEELKQAAPLEMAALTRDWAAFDKLRQGVQPNPRSRLSRAVGDGLLLRASQALEQKDFGAAISWLRESEVCGLSVVNQAWLPATWGAALSSQARLEGNTAEGDRLFSEAGLKYAEAVRIKPDMHDAFYNWGTALSNQARLKGNRPEGDRLFSEAGLKYAEAVRIKPDMHEAFNN